MLTLKMMNIQAVRESSGLMGRIIISLCLFLVANTMIGKGTLHDIEGYYVIEGIELYGGVIQIKNDSLLIYDTFDIAFNGLNSEQVIPLAICKIEKCSDSFYEINSIGGAIISAYKGKNIIPDTVNMADKKSKILSVDFFKEANITVDFEMPNVRQPLRISYERNGESVSDTLVNGKASIVLSIRNDMRISSNSYMFYIFPLSYEPSSLWARYFGLLYIPIMPFYDIKESDLYYIPKITVQLPGITDKVLGQYYLMGDYLRIDGDTLTWKQSKFKKTPPEILKERLKIK